VSFFLACAVPAWRWDLMSLSTLAMLVTFAVAWWKPAEDRPFRNVRAVQRAEAAIRRAARNAGAGRPPAPR
jgi:hypothetical protein